MLINGIDVRSAYGVREWNLEPSYVSLSNRSEWNTGSPLPTLFNTETGLKTQKVKVMIKAPTRAEMWDKGSALINALLKPCTVQFRDFEDRYFKCVLTNASHAEAALRRFHTATLELTGYEYGIERTFESTGSLTLYNIGTLKTPCIVSVTAPEAVVSLTVTGLLRDPYTDVSEPLFLNNLKAGKAVVIDPFTGTVKEGTTSRFSDVTMAEWPSLTPGKNIVSASRSDVVLKITFAPFYL